MHKLKRLNKRFLKKFTDPIKRNVVPIKHINLLLVSWFGFGSLRFVPNKRLSQLSGIDCIR